MYFHLSVHNSLLLTVISGFGRLVHGQKMAKDRKLMAEDRDRAKDYC